MAVICRSYTDEAEARRVVDALLAAGVPGDRVRVLMGEQERDARLEPEGEFAGRTAPDDVVGDFAGQVERSEGEGTFAGSAAEQREGSFGDVDRETVTSYPGGVQREHIAGHHQLRKLLIDAGLSEADADRDVEALHHGRVLVLADVGDRPAEELEQAFAA
jgi:hypothetical protein